MLGRTFRLFASLRRQLQTPARRALHLRRPSVLSSFGIWLSHEKRAEADWIKWWDALENFSSFATEPHDLETSLQLARESKHPDAQWLASLLPIGTPLTAEGMERVLLAQGDDPRALFLVWALQAASGEQGERELSLLQRAADCGYAPALMHLSFELEGVADPAVLCS
jgi:hypothetical protein